MSLLMRKMGDLRGSSNNLKILLEMDSSNTIAKKALDESQLPHVVGLV